MREQKDLGMDKLERQCAKAERISYDNITVYNKGPSTPAEKCSNGESKPPRKNAIKRKQGEESDTRKKVTPEDRKRQRKWGVSSSGQTFLFLSTHWASAGDLAAHTLATHRVES